MSFPERTKAEVLRLRAAARQLPAEALEVAQATIERVAREGDAALRDLTRRFDGVDLPAGDLTVPRSVWAQALASLPEALRQDLELASARVRRHQERLARRAPPPPPEEDEGLTLGEREVPLDAVGVYVPGGSAPLFSTVFMTVWPARAAGVREVAVASPPGPDGLPHPLVLAACLLSGVDRVHPVGGAQAVAALALGTESIAPVDLVAGPGNRYVTAAKLLVFGRVGIDLPAGPSEIVVVADATADPEHVAADLVAQAEHDPDAWALLITTHRPLAEAVGEAVARRLATLPRRAVAEQALLARGGFVVVPDRPEALELADRVAPEHLSLALTAPEEALARIRRAGAVFLGAMPEALGDYLAGPSHVLPTGGSARYASALSPASFRRRLSVLAARPEGLAAVAGAAARLARAEGLEGHAQAVEARLAAPPARPAGSPSDRPDGPT